MSSPAIEAHDRWLLPWQGRKVERLCFDYSVTLMFSGDGELRIEQPFVVRSSDSIETLVVPEDGSRGLAAALQLVHLEVVKVEAFKDGHLEVSFAEGTRLEVPADEGLEAWELLGPNDLRMVSLPGGDLAVWQAES